MYLYLSKIIKYMYHIVYVFKSKRGKTNVETKGGNSNIIISLFYDQKYQGVVPL
jgi:hypothetical protein